VNVRIPLTVTAVALATAAVFTHVQAAGIRAELPALQQAVAEATAQADTLTADLTAAEGEQAQLEAAIAARQPILDARPAFVAAVAGAKKTLDKAKGQVPTDAARKAVLAAQKKVIAATSADQVNKATDQVTKAAEKLAAQNKTWFTRARAFLDAVGGEGVYLATYGGNCGGKIAVACNVGDGSIRVASSFQNQSYDRKVWTMTHELAHTFQRKVWDAIHASGTYQSMFGSNIELLANCMASARGATAHGHTCTPAMVKWAANIWNGHVPS